MLEIVDQLRLAVERGQRGTGSGRTRHTGQQNSDEQRRCCADGRCVLCCVHACLPMFRLRTNSTGNEFRLGGNKGKIWHGRIARGGARANVCAACGGGDERGIVLHTRGSTRMVRVAIERMSACRFKREFG